MDAPNHNSLAELTTLSKDRATWRALAVNIQWKTQQQQKNSMERISNLSYPVLGRDTIS